ncbi:hypothetical protein [Streptomyces sp. NPDC057748]|uniref:hypothetical protein n=1 Tax=Streptomyces sp. NPDC057748 TaxID=3346239 RepID=UPI0036B247EB
MATAATAAEIIKKLSALPPDTEIYVWAFPYYLEEKTLEPAEFVEELPDPDNCGRPVWVIQG